MPSAGDGIEIYDRNWLLPRFPAGAACLAGGAGRSEAAQSAAGVTELQQPFDAVRCASPRFIWSAPSGCSAICRWTCRRRRAHLFAQPAGATCATRDARLFFAALLHGPAGLPAGACRRAIDSRFGRRCISMTAWTSRSASMSARHDQHPDRAARLPSRRHRAGGADAGGGMAAGWARTSPSCAATRAAGCATRCRPASRSWRWTRRCRARPSSRLTMGQAVSSLRLTAGCRFSCRAIFISSWRRT